MLFNPRRSVAAKTLIFALGHKWKSRTKKMFESHMESPVPMYRVNRPCTELKLIFGCITKLEYIYLRPT
jgi:hypothetical protein